MDVRFLSNGFRRRNVHSCNDVSLFNPLSRFDQNKGLVKGSVLGVDERLNTVVKRDRGGAAAAIDWLACRANWYSGCRLLASRFVRTAGTFPGAATRPQVAHECQQFGWLC